MAIKITIIIIMIRTFVERNLEIKAATALQAAVSLKQISFQSFGKCFSRQVTKSQIDG